MHSFIHLSISPPKNNSFINSFILLSIHPFINSFTHPFIYSSIDPFIQPSIWLSIHPTTHLYICSFIHLSIHSLIHPSIQLSIHPSILQTQQWCSSDPDQQCRKTRSMHSNKFEPRGLHCNHCLFIKFHWRTWMKPNAQLNWF